MKGVKIHNLGKSSRTTDPLESRTNESERREGILEGGQWARDWERGWSGMPGEVPLRGDGHFNPRRNNATMIDVRSKHDSG